VVAAALGVLALALTGHPLAVLGGAIVFGAGFGVLQNASIASMYDRVPASGYATVSALWNFAYDAGLGVGAVAFGAVVTHTGYPIAFAATAVLVLAGLPVAIRDRRHLGPSQPGHGA
jgi:predicted MFS family arabinose efflux permease